MKQREGFGLVLAGGGGKGAYEVGVWKALQKTNKIKIGAVSGTSVGALNAALFAIGDYEAAEDIWLHIDKDKILSSNKIKISDYLPQWITMYASIYASIPGVSQLGTLSLSVLINKYLNIHKGFFSRDGLKEIIKKARIAEKIYMSKLPCYATCYNLNEMRTQYFQLDNKFTPEKIESILLASSAIPFVFPKEEIEGKKYYDGGIPFLGDNIPVKPLYEAGWRKFIVIHLEREGVEEFTKKYSGCQFIHVFPRNNQGGMLDGTLDFNPESAKQRLEQGYKDMLGQINILDALEFQLEDREKKIDKIRVASEEYRVYMKEELELDMEDQLDETCRKLVKNKAKLNDFILKGVTAISAANAQLDEKHGKDRKGIFQNLLREVTGKNNRLQQSIDKNMINSQKAVVRMISQLVESDVVSLEVIHSLQNEIYGTTSKMVKVLQEHGKDIDTLNHDFEEISRAYNELINKNKRNIDDINHLYSSILENSKETDKKFNNVNSGISKLRDVQNLQNWYINLKFQQFYGEDYCNLETIEKMICVVSDFFYLTNGLWNDELLLFIKSGLDELGIEPYEQMSYSAVIYKLVTDRRYNKYLFDRNGIYYIFREQEDGIVTSSEALVQGIYIADKFADVQKDITVQQIEGYLSGKGISKEMYLSVFDMACMLLVVMTKYRVCMDDRNSLGAYREIEKKALLGDINAMKRYVEVLLENSYIEEAFNYVSLLDKILINDDEFYRLKCEVIENYSYL